jgi:hypothetical protein
MYGANRKRYPGENGNASNLIYSSNSTGSVDRAAVSVVVLPSVVPQASAWERERVYPREPQHLPAPEEWLASTTLRAQPNASP